MPPEEPLSEAPSPWSPREKVRAFYSGHSLSDGVPERVLAVAGARGQTFEFEVQSLGYSLLRERTKGPDPSSEDWSGYRTGENRRPPQLDVAAELREPTRLSPGGRYDVLVVTERHDLPNAAAREHTATYLAHIAREAWRGNPDAQVLLYHAWLPLDVSAPAPWIRYERKAQRLWECIASRVNLTLDPGTRQRVRVLPGATALAELVEQLFAGRVPGVTLSDPAARVRLLFRDDVHMTPLGTYFMGLVHYAVLYGQPPEGAPEFAGLAPETRAHMEQLAARHVRRYAATADARATRDMESCRALAERVLCAESLATTGPGQGLIAPIRRYFQARTCQRLYAPTSTENPFRTE